MPNNKRRDRGECLVQQARSIKRRTDDLHQRVISVAEMIVRTEADVAATLDRLAENHPHRAARLNGLAEAARANVDHEQKWIEDHTPDRSVI